MKRKDDMGDPADEKQGVEISGDRISYSAGRKVSDGNYGSYDFHCSMSTDVKPGESQGDAVKRAIGFVEKVVEFKCTQAQGEKLKY